MTARRAAPAAGRAAALLLLGLVASALAAGCDRGPRAAEVAAEVVLRVEPTPPRRGPVTLHLRMTAPEGPLAGATVKVEGNMSHAGMVPVFADLRETAPGEYRGDMTLTMGGDWFMLVDARLADGRRLERRIDLPGVRPE